MPQLFGHEKLKVYQKGMAFVQIRSGLLDEVARQVAACDHLDRGAESIVVNIAHASSSWSPKQRIVYLGHANGSALECAACLDVYQASLALSAWVESTRGDFSCSADLLAKLDRSTTAVPLNIAEGSGRFTGADQAKFFKIAHKAAVHSAALLDLSTVGTSAECSRIDEGRRLLRRIAAMLRSLSEAAADED